MSVPIGLVIALGLALALNQTIRGIAWIRTAYFLPVVTSTIAIALVWQWIYARTRVSSTRPSACSASRPSTG